jgi:sugar phosphate isomerase/epimerase
MKQYTEKLLGLLEKGDGASPKYARVKVDFEAKMKARKDTYYGRTKSALAGFAKRAAELGIRLGVENRQALEELPVDADFSALFAEASSSVLAYWHDTGHAQIKQHLGFLQHTDHLRLLAPHLAGFHIHDVLYPGRDHCVPGTGTVDFAALKPFVEPRQIKVFEFSPSLTRDEALAGVDYIKRLWPGD